MQGSGFAEYQACHRVNVDVVDRYPFHLDVVQAAIWLYAPATCVQSILLLIIAASLGRCSSLVHD
jgi:hypothetical protein